MVTKTRFPRLMRILTKALILCQRVPSEHHVLQLGIPRLGVANQDLIPLGTLQVEPLGDGTILTLAKVAISMLWHPQMKKHFLKKRIMG